MIRLLVVAFFLQPSERVHQEHIARNYLSQFDRKSCCFAIKLEKNTGNHNKFQSAIFVRELT